MSNEAEYRYKYFVSYMGVDTKVNELRYGNLIYNCNEKITEAETVQKVENTLAEKTELIKFAIFGITLLKDNGEFGRWTQKN